MRPSRLIPATASLTLLTALALPAAAAQPHVRADGAPTTTSIKHVVVIFQENVSFDHYFGTYPHALNPKGEPAFTALPGTPKVDGYTKRLLLRNPNMRNPLNGLGRSNPFRLDRSQAATADQSHEYTAEQQ